MHRTGCCISGRHEYYTFTRAGSVKTNVFYTDIWRLTKALQARLHAISTQKRDTAVKNFVLSSGVRPASTPPLVSQHRWSAASTHPSCTISVFYTESSPRSTTPRRFYLCRSQMGRKKKHTHWKTISVDRVRLKKKAPALPKHCASVAESPVNKWKGLHDVSKSMSPKTLPTNKKINK